MKLKLTQDEAKSYILRHLGLPADTEVSIVSNPKPALDPKVVDMIDDINDMDYPYSQKIQAIKRFREVVPCGLAEAKWAVENWSRVVSFIDKNKRVPKFEGIYGDGTLVMV